MDIVSITVLDVEPGGHKIGWVVKRGGPLFNHKIQTWEKIVLDNGS